MPPGWEWKAASVETADGEELLVLVQALPRRDNWKAWLMQGPPSSRSVLARLEQHGGAGEGVHVHADCESTQPIFGSESVESAKNRLNSYRNIPWTKESFWRYTCIMFRICSEEANQGSLLV